MIVLLRIVERAESANLSNTDRIEIEQYSGSDERPCKAASASLVSTSNPARTDSAVMGDQARST